jgi:hypothetical protein
MRLRSQSRTLQNQSIAAARAKEEADAQRNSAEKQRIIATQQRNSALLTESRFLADKSMNATV